MAPVAEDFTQRIDEYRSELLAHCYRMLGSVHDAEDLVQETYLRAWRARDQYDDSRASIRTWLYRIATNACLTALESSRSRRPLPSGLVAPSEDPSAPLVRGEVTWLQPLPSALLGADPGKAAVDLGSLRLAFVAAIQHLSARQRAALILRDVLKFSAAESAEILGMSTPAVNSALQRARGQLRDAGVLEDTVAEPSEHEVRARIDRFVEAFERADIAALTRLLTDDVLLEMPPMTNWFIGREHYATFMVWVFSMCTDWRMVRTSANGQPALAAYQRAEGGGYRLHTLQVLTVTTAGISRNTVYRDAEVFAAFGLAEELAGTHSH
ncbi:sigma-70 family RNA polymerase sigma factor [Pseudonocardia spinosispora]|uniref:sigma-70 family RNA polymerase sigma factor n=1 Tax=Pseudonocardia spinosispora TaxID=103441 RepID=UPI0003F4C339|nr:sigma-70 family RNA polymerase sigma factor [Pseudonocardia spinosispora]